MKRLAVMVSGSGSNLERLIEATQNDEINNAKVVLVIASKENIFALKRAKNHAINSVVISKKDFSDEMGYGNTLIKYFKKCQIDYVILAGFLEILPRVVIKAYSRRIINIHPSLVPKYCGKGFYGMRVHRAVYASGEKKTGATVHYVDAGIDTGEIILQKSCRISAQDCPETIAKKVLAIEHVLLPRVIKTLVDID